MKIGKRRPPLTKGNSTWPTALLTYSRVLSLVNAQG